MERSARAARAMHAVLKCVAIGMGSAIVLLAACRADDGTRGNHESPQRGAQGLHGAATGAATARLPDLGALTRLSTGPMAGIATNAERLAIHNPYATDRAAIGEGNRLYVHMNCAYCHGFVGQGGMGPNLADDFWRFGGDDADVFKSIYEGRGKGMPAWGAALTQDDIWKVVAYLRTLRSGPGGPGGTREPMRSMNEHEP